MSSLVVSDFKNVVVRNVRVWERQGKQPLAFVDFVDTDTYQTTGDMLYLKENSTLNDLMQLKSLEKKKVKVVLQLGIYNNRTTINVSDIIPL
ncbi:hypothetical protein [Schinkia azotoformans]|uniref:hypothetical protein n=2 Tax=Schinkia azotoformans TaxID=1454 RepID=UPI002DB5730F|nr:hypothetical protein [Schinkia azotoformans]MEC1715002.1 hypothetical protein [Schinkia azotoformans]MEC1740236.1 hypothetical protein [Schinkia azotoformans]MEC1747145.1 hypothetical protein [Schinkia azotoformans]MEC1766123.1 hypothetical protein [Schinkia azotoformans]MEC1785333.1 hypothetical protein [Schinkia azotoformans]